VFDQILNKSDRYKCYYLRNVMHNMNKVTVVLNEFGIYITCVL
jgi:hypothetical protein